MLEDLLEATKPAYPASAEALHYLIKTPFRYFPHGHGSRFRRAGPGPGVFYGAEHVRTALAELAYYRLKFFAASPQTPLPHNEERLTAFTAEFHSLHALDLTQGALAAERALWTHPTDYTATHALAQAARDAGVTALRYESVRDVEPGFNLALLTPSVFSQPTPTLQQTWLLYISPTEVSCVRDIPRAEAWVFPREHFGL